VPQPDQLVDVSDDGVLRVDGVEVFSLQHGFVKREIPSSAAAGSVESQSTHGC